MESQKSPKNKVYETFFIEIDDKKFAGFWHTKISPNGAESASKFLTIQDASESIPHEELQELFENGELAKVTSDEIYYVRRLISSIGVRRVQEELNITSATNNIDIATKLVNKAFAGEYVGQLMDSFSFQMPNFATCLKLTEDDSHDLINYLSYRKLSGLVNQTVVPYAYQENYYARGKERTGHTRIDTSGTGWYCSACFQSGYEDELSSRDVPCKSTVLFGDV